MRHARLGREAQNEVWPVGGRLMTAQERQVTGFFLCRRLELELALTVPAEVRRWGRSSEFTAEAEANLMLALATGTEAGMHEARDAVVEAWAEASRICDLVGTGWTP